MSRKGISYDQVVAIADSLIAENISPTTSLIRGRLGTGSTGTIHKHLKVWRERHPRSTSAVSEMPRAISDAFYKEINRVSAESRAEVESRFVILQEEADHLAESNIALEEELDKSLEEICAMTNKITVQADSCSSLEAELKGRTEDLHFERTSVNSLQTEVAQLRNKLELLEATVQEQSKIIAALILEKSSESTARISAEKDAAVFAAKLEAEQEKSNALLSDKIALTTQLTAERHSTESVRVQSTILTTELARRTKELTQMAAKTKELSADYEAEKLARADIEKNVKALTDQLSTAKPKPENGDQPSLCNKGQ
jgi:chromosome segregation ATPase